MLCPSACWEKSKIKAASRDVLNNYVLMFVLYFQPYLIDLRIHIFILFFYLDLMQTAEIRESDSPMAAF